MSMIKFLPFLDASHERFSPSLLTGEVANTNDGQMMNHFHGAEHEELATNIYIKEALDVPLFVLNKFYENVDQLGRKIDEVLV